MTAADPLTIAVLGLGGMGRRPLAALQRCPSVQLVGVADRDGDMLDAVETGDLPTFTDSRALLARTQPQAVYTALPPVPAAELIATCAQRGIHVIKEPPLARNLAEGAGLVRQMEQAGLKLMVATQRRFMLTYRRAFELRRSVGRLFLARAEYLFNWGPVIGWRADHVLAGGGALLELGFQFLDLLIWIHSLPEDVFGASAVNARPDLVDANGRPAPPNTTDDTAAAVLRMPGGGMASLIASRASGPVFEQLALHGQDGSLTADSQRCVLRDPDGRVLDQIEDIDDPTTSGSRMIDAFAAAITSGSRTYPCSGRESLLTLAVLDALYLSDKTAAAERPETMLQASGFSIPDCLIHRPLEGHHAD